MPTDFINLFMSLDQGRFALRTMRHAALDGLEIGAEAVPEDLETSFLEAAVRLLVVESVDVVAVARTPEQARVFRTHHLPHRTAQSLALRFFQYRELVEIGQALLFIDM